MVKFLDVADYGEDYRIGMIGEAAMKASENGVAFVTDDFPAGKADRYVKKLLERFPELEVMDRFPGPVKGAVSVKVRRKKK